jgi:hypothetical protein
VIDQTTRYRIVEKLCGGCMGVVYKAEDTQLHRFEPQDLARFQHETKRPRH